MVSKSPKSVFEKVQENIIRGEMNCEVKTKDVDPPDRHASLNNKETDEKIMNMLDSYQQKYIYNGNKK